MVNEWTRDERDQYRRSSDEWKECHADAVRERDEWKARAEQAENARDTVATRAAQLEKALAASRDAHQRSADAHMEWKYRAEAVEARTAPDVPLHQPDGTHMDASHLPIGSDDDPAVPALVAALRAVLDLHTESRLGPDVPHPYCGECGQILPCATRRVTATALGEET